MNGNKYALDTNAVLYILNGDKALAELLDGEILSVSVITEIELLSYKNISETEQQHIQGFLKEFHVATIDEKVKSLTIQLRKKYSLKLPDCIIAATALSLDIPLITSDKQFKQIKELELLYYEK